MKFISRKSLRIRGISWNFIRFWASYLVSLPAYSLIVYSVTLSTAGTYGKVFKALPKTLNDTNSG